jgi:hypothetical protein
MPAPAFRPPIFQADAAVAGALGLASSELTQLKNRGKGDTPAARRLAALIKELMPVYQGLRPLVPGSALALAVEAATRRAEQAKDKVRFAVCGITETLSAFPPGLGLLPADCTPVTRREAKELARMLDDAGALEGLLPPELGQRPARPAVPGARPPAAVRAVSPGAPGLPRPPRKPRPPRAARSARPPRVPRPPRRPRRPRPPRPSRAAKKPRRLPKIGGKGSGRGWWCVKQTSEKWKGIPPRCHNLHASQAAAASAVGGATFTRTEDCEDCQGAGCNGPFGAYFTAVLEKLFGAPPRAAAETPLETRARKAAVRQRRRFLVALERTAGDFDASIHAPPSLQPPGYGWYRCSTPATPNRAAFTHVVWIHASQAAAANSAAGGMFCEGPLGTNPQQKPL